MSYMTAGMILLGIVGALLLIGGGAATAIAQLVLYLFVAMLVFSLLAIVLGWTPVRPSGVTEEDEDAALNPRGLPTDET